MVPDSHEAPRGRSDPGSRGSEQGRQLRTRSLQASLVCAILARCSGAVLQLIAIPVAVHHLGTAGYAALLGLVAFSLMPVALSIRLGPSFVAENSADFVASNLDSMRTRLWSTTLVVCTIQGLLGVVGTIIAYFASDLGYLDSVFEKTTDEPSPFTLLVFLLGIHLCGGVCLIFEEVQAAMQRQYFISIRTLVANLVAILSVVYLFPMCPSLSALIIILYGIPLIGRAVNVLVFVCSHSELFPQASSFHLRIGLSTVRSAIIYTAVAGVGAYGANQLPLMPGAIFLESGSVAQFGCCVQLLLQGFSVLSMFVVPYIPALGHSLAADDLRWTQVSFLRLCVFSGSASLLIGVFLVSARSWVFGYLIQDSTVSFWLAFSLSLYLVTLFLEFLLFQVVCVLRSSTVRHHYYFLLRSGLTGLSAFAAFWLGWVPGFFLLAAFWTIVISLRIYSQMVRDDLKLHSQNPIRVLLAR